MTTRKKPIRNERFKFLLKSRFEGNKAAMAEALDIAPSLVWRYANGKGIGEDMKKHIHLKLKLNDEWLDGTDEPVGQFISKRKKDIENLNAIQESLDDEDFLRVQAFCEALVFSKKHKESNDKED
jgi:hypothetical protein